MLLAGSLFSLPSSSGMVAAALTCPDNLPPRLLFAYSPGACCRRCVGSTCREPSDDWLARWGSWSLCDTCH
jgi:hypothetical protein